MCMSQPFLLLNDLLSLHICEDIVNDLYTINLLDDIDTTALHKREELTDEALVDIMLRLGKHISPSIESHFNVKVNKIEHIEYECVFSPHPVSEPSCENSTYIKEFNQWMRDKSYDFTAVLFLKSEYDKTEDIDTSIEVYGGTLQFPQHNIKLHPSAGCVVVFPSDPHFINIIGTVQMGSLFLIRMHFSCDTMYIYNPKKGD